MFTSAPHSALIAVVVSAGCQGPCCLPCCLCCCLNGARNVESCPYTGQHTTATERTTAHMHVLYPSFTFELLLIAQLSHKKVARSPMTPDLSTIQHLSCLCGHQLPSPAHYCLFIKSSTHPNTVHVDTGITNYWFSEYYKILVTKELRNSCRVHRHRLNQPGSAEAEQDCGSNCARNYEFHNDLYYHQHQMMLLHLVIISFSFIL